MFETGAFVSRILNLGGTKGGATEPQHVEVASAGSSARGRLRPGSAGTGGSSTTQVANARPQGKSRRQRKEAPSATPTLQVFMERQQLAKQTTTVEAGPAAPEPPRCSKTTGRTTRSALRTSAIVSMLTTLIFSTSSATGWSARLRRTSKP